MGQTDKIDQGYLPTYQRIAQELGPAARICEVGVLRGESLELFQQLFPESPVMVGVDKDTNSLWPEGTIKIYAWQDDPKLDLKLLEHSPTYDLIVDDASHIGHLSRKTFQTLWPLVRPGGYYVVEDWHVGFGHHHAFYGDTSMLDLAKDLLDELDNGHGIVQTDKQTVEDIYYRDGLIVLKKRLPTVPKPPPPPPVKLSAVSFKPFPTRQNRVDVDEPPSSETDIQS